MNLAAAKKQIIARSKSGEFVQRSRAGDQNATAILAVIRDLKDQGVDWAKEAYSWCMDYAKRHKPSMFGAFREVARSLRDTVKIPRPVDSPVGEESANNSTNDNKEKKPTGAEYDCTLVYLLTLLDKLGGEEALLMGAVIMANGPALNDSRIKQFLGSFREDVADQLVEGIVHCFVNTDSNVTRAGQCIGQARRLQILRLPDGPIKAYNPKIAFELGEK